MAINQEEIIGMLLPYVSISRVTLGSSGFTRTEENPHIDSPLENPTPNNSSGLRIRLDLFLKDVIDDDAISTWFSQQDFAKYISLKIFQSVDPRITSVLSAGREMIALADPDASVSYNDARNSILVEALETDSVAKAREILFRKVKYRKLSLKNDMLGSSSKLSKHGAKVDSDGDKVFEINYSVDFELPELKPEHISYFAMTSLDVESLTADFGLDFQAANLYRMNGNLVSEIVIDDYKVKSTSTLYYTEDGKTWPGPMHKHAGKLRTGFEESVTSKDVKKATVINSVVQDFRVAAAIKQIPLDFSSFEKPVFKDPIRNKDNKDVRGVESYFSDMFLTKDENNNSRFLFATNVRNLVLHNTVYGSFIKSMSPLAFAELLRDTKITSLKVWRKRVKVVAKPNNDPKTGLDTTIVDFDQNNSPPELVVSTREKSLGEISSINNESSNIRESKLKVADSNGVRFFTGMDKAARRLNNGTYQYGVELEINDASVALFNRHLSSLENAKKELIAYYNEATIPTMSKYLAEVSNPHIDHPDEFAGTYGNTYGGWDPYLQRFSQSFIRKIRKKYVDKRNQAPWIKSVAVYLDALNVFTNILATPAVRGRLLLTLGMYTNPRTATPKGIGVVIDLMDTLASKIIEILKTTGGTSRHGASSAQESRSLGTGKDTSSSVRVLKYLYGIYNADLNKKPSTDYLGIPSGDSTGLLTMQPLQWQRRINTETERLFNSKDPDVNVRTGGGRLTTNDTVDSQSHGYLSPHTMHLSENSISLVPGTPPARLPVDETPEESDKGTGNIDRTVRSISSFGVSPSKAMTELQANALLENSKDYVSPPNAGSRSESPNPASDTRTSVAIGQYMADNLNIIVKSAEIDVEKTERGLLRLRLMTPNEFSDIIAPCGGKIIDKVIESGAQPQEGAKENDVEEAQVVNRILGPLINQLSTARTTTPKESKSFSFAGSRSAAAGAAPRGRTRVSHFRPNNLEPSGDSFVGNGYSITSLEMTGLPNHFKALYRASSGESNINPSLGSLVANLASTNGSAIGAAAQFTFNFGMISKVEFLAGFERDIAGEIIVGAEEWVQLTKEKYEKFIGKEVLCRFKDYENLKLGIEKNNGLLQSIVNEYFILIPEVQEPLPAPTFPTLAGPETPSIVVPDAITLAGSELKNTSPAPSTGNSRERELNLHFLNAIDCETENISSDDTQTNNNDDNGLNVDGVDCLTPETRAEFEDMLAESEHLFRVMSNKLERYNNDMAVLLSLKSRIPPPADIEERIEELNNTINKALEKQNGHANDISAHRAKLELPICTDSFLNPNISRTNVEAPDPCDDETPASAAENNGNPPENFPSPQVTSPVVGVIEEIVEARETVANDATRAFIKLF